MIRKGKQIAMSLFAVMSLLGTGEAYGQTYLVNEGFEGMAFPPKGWTVIDNDGDGHCWQVAGKGQATLSGLQIAISYTVNPENISPYAAQDNYLVTPQIRVANGAYKLSFKYCAEDEDTKENLQVLISETGNSVADFTKVLKDITVENGYDGVELQSAEISLSEYEGKNVYIAFRHTGTNTYALGIDDVKISNEKGPKTISGLTVTPGAEGKLSATLSWTNPSKNGAGENLTGNLAVGIYRDNYLIKALGDGVAAGEKSEYTDNDVKTGNHVYSVVAKTDEGESLPVSKSVYVGEDIPAAISEVLVSSARGVNTITWTAPSKGANNGYINPQNITYGITRNIGKESIMLSSNLKELNYTDKPETGKLVSYTVVPMNDAGVGSGTRSGSALAYDASLADINLTPNATAAYANPKLPFDMSQKISVSQSVFYPSDFKHAYGTISDIVLKNSFRNSTLDKPVKIWLAETDREDLSDGWMSAADMTLVYDGTLSFQPGANDIPVHLSSPYSYGGKNLVMLAYMGAAEGTGSYFDRFFVESLDAKAVRTLAYSSYSADFDIASLADATADKCQALPAARFVLNAKGVADVNGVVTDKSTGKPVESATVSVDEMGVSVVTSADGSYELGLIKSGNYKFTITATGYTDFTAAVAVGEGAQTENFELSEMPKVNVSGKVSLQGVSTAKGVKITAQGYSDSQAIADENGNYTIPLYSGKEYTLTASYPLFDNKRISIEVAEEKSGVDFTLSRSLISPFALTATLADDGKSMNLTWKDPLSRDGKRQWTTVGNSAVNDGTSSEYYSPSDFYVAHAFSATDIADSSMVGMSFMKVKAYLKATKGKIYAEVFKGTKESHSLLLSKDITDKVSADGGWVEADFHDTPVEIRQGESYLVAIHCADGSDCEIGHGPSYSKIEGRNNVKWSDVATTYNGYYAWNITACCDIPGCTDGTYEKPETALPPYTYNVYRTAAAEGAAPVLLKENVPAETLSYTDDKWTYTESGKYLYTVEAVYGSDQMSYPAQSDTVVRSADYDAGVAAILSPVKTADEQTEVNVRVSIKNYGEKPLTSVPVYVKFDDDNILTKTFEGNIVKGATAEVDLGTANLNADTYYNIEAYTKLDGDAMPENDGVSMTLPNLKDVNLRAFRWDAYGDAGVFNIHSNIPEQAEYVKEITPNNYLLNAAEYLGGKVYGFTATYNSVPGEFVELDPQTWAPVNAYPTSVYVMDMAYDYSSSAMYALGVMDNKVCLMTVNVKNGVCAKVADLDKSLHTLACTTDGKLYAIGRDGNLYFLDKTNGAATVVGSTGVDDVMYLQTMAFDHNTGRLFWVHDGQYTAGELFEVDPADASVRQLGTVMFSGYPSCMIGMYVPYTHTSAVRGVNTDSDVMQVSAYVNAAGNVVVDMPMLQGETAAVSVVTLAGSTLANVTAASAHTVVPVNLPAGVYIVKVYMQNGKKVSVKVKK